MSVTDWANLSMGAVALLVLGYVAITAVQKRRNGKDQPKAPSTPDGPDLGKVVENNTEAMRDLSGVVGGLKDFLLQSTTRQEVKLDEVLAHVRTRGGGSP